MAWWVWIVLGGVLLVAEVFLPTDFFLVFFGVAAFILGILGLTLPPLSPVIQWLLYAALSVISLLAFRRRLQRRFAHKQDVTVDAIVGQAAVAQDAIAPGDRGRVELRGTTWTAHNVGAVALGTGDRCVVDAIHGLSLDVRPSSD
jgi:membrane protein implicated in regulation of membrane protease activity